MAITKKSKNEIQNLLNAGASEAKKNVTYRLTTDTVGRLESVKKKYEQKTGNKLPLSDLMEVLTIELIDEIEKNLGTEEKK